jgi:hypothetical protein
MGSSSLLVDDFLTSIRVIRLVGNWVNDGN